MVPNSRRWSEGNLEFVADTRKCLQFASVFVIVSYPELVGGNYRKYTVESVAFFSELFN